MRFGRWLENGRRFEGVIRESEAHPFTDGTTVLDAIRAGLEARHRYDVPRGPDSRPLDSVQLISPIDPVTLRDFIAFEEHLEGVSAAVDGKSHVVPEWYEAPTFYFSNIHTILGPGEAVRPPQTHRLDFELEVAAVIGGVDGSEGRNLTVDEADAHLFGYLIMNDWSARDLQTREMNVRLGPAKGKDFATTLGPWIVTADELRPCVDADGLLQLQARAYVNGALVGEDLVSNMSWTFAELIAYAARDSRVVPGDVLGSGTVGNGGCLAELWGRSGASEPAPLRTGDSVRLVVQGLGELRNTVDAAQPRPEIPSARRHAPPRARRISLPSHM